MTKKKLPQLDKAQKTVNEGFNLLNHFIQNVEGELDRALKTARQQSRRSANTLKKRVDGLMENMGVNDLRKKAAETSTGLRKEIERFSTGVLKQIRTVEHKIEDGMIDDIVDKLKDNVSSTVTKLQDMEVVEFARHKMMDTREQVLSALQIPSNSDLEQLTRKLSVLEKKLNALRKNNGAHQ
jgi:hypothetical protein